MTDSSRDARRRRILERGSDRLALISGQIQNLPSDSVSDLPQADGHSRTASCPPSITQAQSPDPPSQTFDSAQNESKPSGIPRPNRNSVPDSSTKPSKVPSHDLDGKSSPVEVPSEIQNPRDSSSYKDQRLKTLTHICNIFPYNEVKYVISASESTRSLCSFAVAILVVFAYVGFPLLGSRLVKSIISFRPLFLLLLTNITILIAPLLEKQRSLQTPEVQAGAGGEGLVDPTSASFELGLVLLNVTSALFMDCSIYAITVVCGMSVAQSLGW